MRTLLLLFATIAGLAVKAQGTRTTEPGDRGERHPWVRVDAGFGVGACQGSYLQEVDWDQVYYGPHKAERASYWPPLYVELELRPWTHLGLVANANWWQNGRSIEAANLGFTYNSEAHTFLLGGRWYYGFDTPRMEWYSGIMGGWSHNTSDGSPGVPVVDRTFFAHQITFIGFRRAGPVGISMELGQGFKGFLAMGLSIAL